MDGGVGLSGVSVFFFGVGDGMGRGEDRASILSV